MARGNDEEEKVVTIDDFVSEQKVRAFVEAYAPAESQTLATEVFDDARLRTFFRAYPIPKVGDPLVRYLELLEEHDFRLHVSLENEPAIFANARINIDRKLLEADYF